LNLLNVFEGLIDPKFLILNLESYFVLTNFSFLLQKHTFPESIHTQHNEMNYDFPQSE